MANSELLSYVKQVMDLETSIYTNQCLQEGVSSSMAAQAPVHPRKSKREEVTEPFHPETPKLTPKWCAPVIILFGILFFVFTWAKNTFVSSTWWLAIFIYGIMAEYFVVGVYSKNKDKKAKYDDAIEEYNREIEIYKKESAEAEKRNQEREQTYQSEVEIYKRSLAVFENECGKSRESIIEAGDHLKSSLEQLYGANVIYPKYRNLVAITTIYEYLASGRCDTLEGADGAYNLYEMELRQNIIIGQLSSVLDSLEQIKNSQFTLYSELEESNRKSADLLSNISDNVEFSRYASEEIAKSNKALERNTEATKYYTLFNAAKRK